MAKLTHKEATIGTTNPILDMASLAQVPHTHSKAGIIKQAHTLKCPCCSCFCFMKPKKGKAKVKEVKETKEEKKVEEKKD
ncbi:hypothetical protein CR513_56546, partial [Mucuna pruriens]